MAQIGAVQLQIKPNPNDVNFLDFVVDYDVIFTPIEITANLPYSKRYVVIGVDTPAADTGPPPDPQPAAGGNDTLAAFPNFGGGVKPGGTRVVHVTDTLRVARAVADEDKPPIPNPDELQVRVELQSLPPLLPIVRITRNSNIVKINLTMEPGMCVPVTPESKPKQSRRSKLDKLLTNTRVPSALGASFFHLTRRFLAGKTAANALEEKTFARLRQLPPDLQQVLSCTSSSFNLLSSNERSRLFASDLLRDVNQPLDIAQLTQTFAQEIVQNVGIQVFGDPRCATEEHPGKVRTMPYPGGEFPPSQVRICRINGLRTGYFIPRLALGEYTPAEVQQRCHVILDGNEPKQVCEVQTTNCPGTDLGGLCLRVQEVEAGQAVLLEGVNFSSIDTKVRLSEVANFPIERDVDAHVCGDDQTPRTEIVNGKEVLITDCRVRDRLTFRVPDDLPPGLYDVQVFVPNVSGIPGWGDVLNSDGVRGITVVPPSSARFQIASETLHCRNETGSTSVGSDEVGINILAVPLFPDLTGGDVQQPNGGKPIRFGDVDSGETRAMDHLLFIHQQPIAGAALSIMGYEVDGEEAFRRQIESFSEAFVEILKDQLEFLMDHLKDVGAIVSKLAKYGLKGAIAGAIAAAVVLAIDVFVAIWAPADLIIEDTLGPITLDLVELTSVNFPLPVPSEHITAQGIKVRVTPLDKVPHQYRERREYISDDENSRYQIVLRYNRLA